MDVYSGQNKRDRLFYRVMGHQGLHTLRMMLLGLPDETRDFVWRVRADIDGLGADEVDGKQKSIGWTSMASDLDAFGVKEF